MEMDVLVLAGGLNKGELKEFSSNNHEALIKIDGRPMVEYVISAVKKAQNTSRIAVIGPQEKIQNSLNEKVDMIIESSDSMVDNIIKGVNKLASRNYVLIVTSDIPLITKEVIEEFINSCQEKEADIYYPVISKEKNQEKFPEAGRTYVRLVEGTFTGGNIVIIKPEVLNDIAELLRKVMLFRKNPWKLSRLLGFKFVLKLILGKLSLKGIEERVSEMIGYKSSSIKIDYPELGFDIDKPSDLKIIDKYLHEQHQSKTISNS